MQESEMKSTLTLFCISSEISRKNVAKKKISKSFYTIKYISVVLLNCVDSHCFVTFPHTDTFVRGLGEGCKYNIQISVVLCTLIAAGGRKASPLFHDWNERHTEF
jgi:hypothetical protein